MDGDVTDSFSRSTLIKPNADEWVIDTEQDANNEQRFLQLMRCLKFSLCNDDSHCALTSVQPLYPEQTWWNAPLISSSGQNSLFLLSYYLIKWQIHGFTVRWPLAAKYNKLSDKGLKCCCVLHLKATVVQSLDPHSCRNKLKEIKYSLRFV